MEWMLLVQLISWAILVHALQLMRTTHCLHYSTRVSHERRNNETKCNEVVVFEQARKGIRTFLIKDTVTVIQHCLCADSFAFGVV